MYKPVVFQPRGRLRPIFFLHIPKTAGSSNNTFLRSIYGRRGVVTHLETRLGDLLAGRARPLRQDCLSGHVPLWRWDSYAGSDVFDRVTLLRDPWARLVSHVNWVASYARGRRMPKRGAGARALARVAGYIDQMDFADRRDLLTLRNLVDGDRDFAAFDNFQVRMLRTGRMGIMEGPLRAADVDTAVDELRGFFSFGFCEAQLQFQTELLARLGVVRSAPRPIVANLARRHLLSPANDLARDILAPWIDGDEELVRRAYGLKGVGRAALGTSLDRASQMHPEKGHPCEVAFSGSLVPGSLGSQGPANATSR